MSVSEYVSDIPSSATRLLERFVGQKVVRLVRYSWWPKEDVPQQCAIQPRDAFSLTSGPLAVTFHGGETLGIASDSSLNSVVVWLDRTADGLALRPPAMDEDPQVFSIEVSDPVFSQPEWSRVLGAALARVSVLHMKSSSILKNELPSEVGLCLYWEGGAKLIAAHGLHDGSDDFVVLTDEQVDPALLSQLEERRLL